MSDSRRTLVYLAGYTPDDPFARALIATIEGADLDAIDLQIWPSASEAAAEIERSAARGALVPALVLLHGEGVIAAAQQIRTAAPSTQLTFLADWRERTDLQPELRGASLGHGWAFALPDPPNLIDTIRDAIATSGHRRQVRTTIDRGLVRISADQLSAQRVRDLAISDALLGAIMRDTVDAIVVADDRRRIISANPSALRLFGDELLRMELSELLPSCDNLDAIVGRVSEQRARTPDGGEIPVDLTLSRVTVGSSLGGYAIVARDARERVAAQAELERQAELTSTVIEGIAEGVYVIDAFGNLLFMNAAAESMLGWPRAELATRNVHDAIHRNAGEAAECPLLQAIRRGVPLRTEEIFTRRDGTPVPVECAVTPVRLGETVVGGVFNFHDLTPHRAVQEQLKAEKDALSRLIREKDDFIATVSHELRTPLTSIIGWLQLVSSGDIDRQEMTEALEAIETSARAQAQIVNDLLDVSRVISGKLHLTMGRVDVGDVLNAAASTLYPSARSKGITLTVTESARGLDVCGDAGRLNQIVWNLLSNAIKFTPDGGRVSVHAERADGAVRITVSDTGIGIPPETLPSIFDPYRQAGDATARGGLGLGLAIVRTLVELHKGRVAVESEVNRGTTFSVELPPFVAKDDCGAATG